MYVPEMLKIGPYAFGSCTVASSWRDLVDTEKVITLAWRQCIPSKLHEPLAQEYGVTSQKIVILNYPVGTPHIISNDFTSQQPYLSLSRQSLFLAPNHAVAAWHHSTSPSCLFSFYRFLHWAKQRLAPKQTTKVWDVRRCQTWRSALAKRPWGPQPQIYKPNNCRPEQQ